jgi:hypothetical protein
MPISRRGFRDNVDHLSRSLAQFETSISVISLRQRFEGEQKIDVDARGRSPRQSPPSQTDLSPWT